MEPCWVTTTVPVQPGDTVILAHGQRAAIKAHVLDVGEGRAYVQPDQLANNGDWVVVSILPPT